MENKVYLLAAVVLLMLAEAGSALQVSYMYVNLGFPHGIYPPWLMVTECGLKGYGSPIYELCPYPRYGHYPCDDPITFAQCQTDNLDLLSDYKLPSPLGSYSGLVAKITIPEDFKLVDSQNNVVGDEVCLGEKVSVMKGVSKGEYWSDGGHMDSPPIYWVPDVEKVARDVIDYYRKNPNWYYNWSDYCPRVQEGYVDDIVKAPFYYLNIPAGPNGSLGSNISMGISLGILLCDLKASSDQDYAGDYVLDKPEEFDLSATYKVRCMYYEYGSLINRLGWGDDYECLLTRSPMVLQAGPDATVADSGTYNIFLNSSEDFFKIGEIGIKKKIRVVSPANPKLEVSVSGANKLALNQPNVLRVLVRNSGDVDVDLSDVKSNAVHKFVSCDAKTVAPGGTVECLIEITPKVGEGVSVSVNYGYRSCGRVTNGVVSKDVISSQVVKASSMSQVYALDVSGGCVNRYYVCNSALEQQWFSLGFKCSTNEANKYVVSSVERIDLGFGLPPLPEGATVAGARLGLVASGASKAQDVSVYSVSGWSQAFCVPGGDICAQPYCSECKPLFDASGQQLGTTYVAGPGKYYVDLTEAVKEAYQNEARRVSLQLRGKEDYSADSGSCGTGKDWTRYDLNFRGKADAPYLEIVYAK